MRRSFVALGPIALALILSACVGDRDSTASRLNAPAGALASGNPNACDFNGMTRAGRDWGGPQDVIVKTLIPAMQTAYNDGGGTAAATPKGLDILAQIAAERLTILQIGTNAQGAILVNDVLSPKCSDIRLGVPQATQDEFDAEKALAGGVFEVRGGANARAAVAFVPVTTGGRVEASPRWGVAPTSGCSSDATGLCLWPALSATQQRYLITAYPTTTSLGGETAAITTELNGGNGFVVGMMPDIANKSVFLVGVCVSAVVTDAANNIIAANLGFHNNTLLVPTTSAVCDPDYPTQAMLDSRSWFASLTHRAASWLAPSRLFAGTRSDAVDWVGPTGWSPVTFARITGTGTSLTFVGIPKNGTVGTDFVLHVLASTSAGHPVPGVTISIALANNSGVPAGAVITPDPATGLTGPDGVASITLRVDKAGGYTFVANGTLFGGAATNTVVSTQVLNIKNAHP